MVKIGIWKCWFLRRGETEVPREKPLGARERTNNKLKPHMESTLGIEPGPHWWEASALTIASSLPPKVWHNKYCRRFCSVVFLYYLCIFFILKVVSGSIFFYLKSPLNEQVLLKDEDFLIYIALKLYKYSKSLKRKKKLTRRKTPQSFHNRIIYCARINDS